jgi:hypothetical protein
MNDRRLSASISLEEAAPFATLHSRLSSWALRLYFFLKNTAISPFFCRKLYFIKP